MKRSMAVLAALAIGFTYNPPGAVALAEENEEKIIEAEDNAVESEEDTAEKEGAFFNHLLGNLFSIKEEKEALQDDSRKTTKENREKVALSREASELKNLQIPQKFEVVIDPWEMDGKGQIYSEQYLISNTGDMPGILTLSNLVCRPREQSRVIVKTDKEGLHDSGDKFIYMEMLFGNEERIVFSEGNSQYQTELDPGEELSVCFVGEVNENAFGKWKNDDIAVSLVYSWEMEEKQANDDVEKGEQPRIDDNKGLEYTEEKQQGDIDEENPEKKETEDTNAENLEGSLQTDISLENSEETSGSDENDGEMQEQQDGSDKIISGGKSSDNIDAETHQTICPSFSTETVNGQEASEAYLEDNMPEKTQKVCMQDEQILSESILEISDKEKEKEKDIELKEPQNINVAINSWIVDEMGKITSTKYKLKNTGNFTGTWIIRELFCNTEKQSGIRICTDQKDVQGENVKSIYMELVLGSGEKVILSQKNSEYKVKLEPGEEVLIYFAGEMSRDLFEIWEEKSLEVTAACSWNLDQTVME